MAAIVLKGGMISKQNVSVTSSVTATAFTGSYFGTSSWSANSLTASNINFTPSSSSYAGTSSLLLGSITSASYALSASFAPGSPSVSASYATSASYVIPDATVSTLIEEFYGAGTATNTVGLYGWGFANGSIQVANAQLNHPGIITRRSGTTANQIATFFIGTSATATTLALGNLDKFNFVIQPITATSFTGSLIRVGLLTSAATLAQANGLYFEKSQSLQGHWNCVYVSASVLNRFSSSVLVAVNTWANLKCTVVGSTITWNINGTNVATMAYSSSHNNTALVFGTQLAPANAAAIDLSFDYACLCADAISR